MKLAGVIIRGAIVAFSVTSAHSTAGADVAKAAAPEALAEMANAERRFLTGSGAGGGTSGAGPVPVVAAAMGAGAAALSSVVASVFVKNYRRRRKDAGAGAADDEEATPRGDGFDNLESFAMNDFMDSVFNDVQDVTGDAGTVSGVDDSEVAPGEKLLTLRFNDGF